MPVTTTQEGSSGSEESVALKMALEIHLPGLELDTKRWNYHTIFMTAVRENLALVGAQAYEASCQQGRGIFFADAEQWLRIVKRQFEAVQQPFPVQYLPKEQARSVVDFGPLHPGFVNLVDTYDPARQFMLVVNHHPGDLLSCYLIAPEPGPAELYRRSGAGLRPSDEAPISPVAPVAVEPRA